MRKFLLRIFLWLLGHTNVPYTIFLLDSDESEEAYIKDHEDNLIFKASDIKLTNVYREYNKLVQYCEKPCVVSDQDSIAYTNIKYKDEDTDLVIVHRDTLKKLIDMYRYGSYFLTQKRKCKEVLKELSES